MGRNKLSTIESVTEKGHAMNFRDGTVFLVTGGAGFIGSNLCEAILNMGNCKIRCLDNLSTGKRENIAMFLSNPAFSFIEGDICDFDTCIKAVEGADYVLHQAAWGSVPRSIEQPILYNKINAQGTLNMMEASRISGVKKFVYASSSSVYGDAPDLPKKEGVEGNCLSPYAITKITCEKYGYVYKKIFGLDTYGLRYFNVFGKKQDPDSEYAAVIPKFIKQLLKNESPIIYGDGTQSRDFTYVDNVVEANLRACLAPSEAAGEAFNIAYGEQTVLLDLYNLLNDMLGIKMPPIMRPPRAGDIKHSHADISKAKSMLGYMPRYSFADGISLALDWYREHLKRKR